jgi:hypothetical protein
MSLERGPLSLVSTTEELLERKSSGTGLESREYGRGDPSRWPRGTLYPQKLALTSMTSGGRSVGMVRCRTKATEFVSFCLFNGSEPLPLITPTHGVSRATAGRAQRYFRRPYLSVFGYQR